MIFLSIGDRFYGLVVDSRESSFLVVGTKIGLSRLLSPDPNDRPGCKMLFIPIDLMKILFLLDSLD